MLLHFIFIWLVFLTILPKQSGEVIRWIVGKFKEGYNKTTKSEGE